MQRETLAELYRNIGFARSLVAYELPDGRLKLIDGHLRRDLDPDMLVDVEVLDVNEAEARILLLSLDSLANLAEPDEEAVQQLRASCQADAPALEDFWATLGPADSAKADLGDAIGRKEQFLIVLECTDEPEQVRLLQRFHDEGIPCRALVL
jgi:hypothetical protein